MLVVLPRGVPPRRHFAAAAIAWAFALLGLLGQSQGAVWAAISAWGEPRSRWITIKRWAAAVVAGRLFDCVTGLARDAELRCVAERVGAVVRAHAPLRGGLADEVFAGAPFAAHAR